MEESDNAVAIVDVDKAVSIVDVDGAVSNVGRVRVQAGLRSSYLLGVSAGGMDLEHGLEAWT